MVWYFCSDSIPLIIHRNIAMKSLLIILTAFVALGSLTAQELKLPSLSPTQTLSQDFSTSKIEITYSRPSSRGRTVFGELVPFGQPWRTGANAATKITFGEDVEIGGTTVKAGTYSLASIPTASEWELILNKNTGSWPGKLFDAKDDVLRTKIRTQSSATKTETFTISIENVAFSTCTIDIRWENTHVSIPVKANNEKRISDNIERAINNPTIPYYQAASYYYETNQNLDAALKYATIAAEKNATAYWIQMLRARIAAKAGNKDVARSAANTVISMVKGTPAEAEYTKYANDVLNSVK
jgi:hypothetical protein